MGTSHPLPVTQHPEWLTHVIESLREPWQRAVWPRLFDETVHGQLPPIEIWRRVVCDFFVIVENFPKYLALSLAKSSYGRRAGDDRVRRWFLQNLAVEARHAEWYLDWAEALGVSREQVCGATPCDEVRALHEHLWTLCRDGTLIEGVAAANWAIEGVTGQWTRALVEPIRKYGDRGFRVDARSMMWLAAHARYDDAHPDEALEVMKLYVDDDAAVVADAARTALDYFAAGVERCYQLTTR